ncbi:ABC transporter substrate-binding protein [Sphingomonas elodea]|uniref:ABC transporter substrate-binding protein n=1 Tax=Sphingomonas elodea TaxID=179878 RepID=UPI0002630D10|nr:ABC transporter substrate-binding protein [Sphingomonas elodea]
MRPAAITLALMLTACSAAGAGNPSSDPRPPAAGFDRLSYPRADYAEAKPGMAGGTLVVAAARDNGTLDWQLLADTNSKWLARMTGDSLVYLDEQGAITPWLATAWTVSPDGLVYTFTLRDGVTFADGTPLDAEAVRVNLDRIRNPATRAAMTTAYIAPYVRGEVVDRLTFRAHLSEPYAPFLNVLAQAWFGLISPKQIREAPETIATAPIGSGPFVVTRYVRQQEVVLTRRTDYAWSPPLTGHKGPAYLERIIVRTLPEALSRYTALKAGEVDFLNDAPAQKAAIIRSDPELVFRNRINLGNPVRGITFNVDRAPFNDPRLRLAFAKAIDRNALSRGPGFAEYAPTTAFLSASTPYRDTAVVKPLGYDPAGANRLLDAAGWQARGADGIRVKDGKRLRLAVLTSNANGLDQVLVGIQSEVRKVGIDLAIDLVPVAQQTERRRLGNYEAFGPGYWHTNTPDGLYIVYHGKQRDDGPYRGQNNSRLADPQLDAILAEARRGASPERLAALYRSAQARLAELVPAIPTSENHTLVAYRADVRGLIFDTSHNTPRFETVWLDRRGS